MLKHTLCTSIKLKLCGDNETIITYPRDNAEHWSQRQWVRWTFGIITNGVQIVHDNIFHQFPIYNSRRICPNENEKCDLQCGYGTEWWQCLVRPGVWLLSLVTSWHSWHRPQQQVILFMTSSVTNPSNKYSSPISFYCLFKLSLYSIFDWLR